MTTPEDMERVEAELLGLDGRQRTDQQAQGAEGFMGWATIVTAVIVGLACVALVGMVLRANGGSVE